MRGITHWESPNFFAYFKPHASFPSVLGELFCAGLNVMGFQWIASPALTELESIVMDWLAKLMSLSKAFWCNGGSGKGGGVIQGSAGESAIVALLAALGLALAACGDRGGAERPPQPGDEAVARVDGKTVWASDVKREAVAQGARDGSAFHDRAKAGAVDREADWLALPAVVKIPGADLRRARGRAVGSRMDA